MAFVDYLPILRPATQSTPALYDSARTEELAPDQSQLNGKMRPKSFKLVSGSLFNFIYRGEDFEYPDFDLDRIAKITEADGMVKQSLARYRELMWKEQPTVTGENAEAVDYLNQRLSLMEMAMKEPFKVFLQEVSDQLFKFHNVFIAKARADLPFRINGRPIEGANSRRPVVGYYLVPAETMRVKRSQHGHVLKYRQELGSHAGLNGSKGQAPEWDPQDMIHITVDRKPGRAYGTPFMVSVLDDVVALRALEDDVQQLVHKELFPIYQYKVGTENAPAMEGEVDQAVAELEQMLADGGIAVPERHEISVINDKSGILDANSYLAHFVMRVCVGMGVSPQHLGIMNSGGNRSVSERLDIAMYDRVKMYQRVFAEHVRLQIFNELLIEANFNPLTHPSGDGESERCYLSFPDIDVDTQVKKENHIIAKFQANLLSLAEARNELGLPMEVDIDDLLIALQALFTPTGGSGQAPAAESPDGNQPSSGGTPNQKDDTKRAKNRSRPANQYGRRSSPNIKRDLDDLDMMEEVEVEEDDLGFLLGDEGLDGLSSFDEDLDQLLLDLLLED